jgi:hypothetical protein
MNNDYEEFAIKWIKRIKLEEKLLKISMLKWQRGIHNQDTELLTTFNFLYVKVFLVARLKREISFVILRYPDCRDPTRERLTETHCTPIVT